ncbi:3-hydroxyacyl-CoA dehydrogenase family protein [Domibacillus epiphyticus]|uniref:3-hydroxybutyryl-CoA dehydrogenase n=1 Tax=Domibacillus epiphyticus TaxID=1714355 RepID=A0A1V2A8H7_9BACI|nr:3-hydroxyacyl-CoA dehydrogenase family protein [Domibacillus epiphyticus]OMP67298.1 3-hydroxybutyryl-CoA dehydrogenase [Domibacillus epiphyticus]
MKPSTDQKTLYVVGSEMIAGSIMKDIEKKGFRLATKEELERERQNVDLVIETTCLDLEKKKANLQMIEAAVEESTLILSSVLSISATESASFLNNPSRLVGFGILGSWEEAALVEVAPALQTDEEYLDQVSNLLSEFDKEMEVVQDEAGLVFPRILSLIINEAAFALNEGIASASEIDIAMMKGTNYPMGPLAWADKVGIDNVYSVLMGLHRSLGEERYRPAPLIRKMVHAGWLGEQTGKGFYET